MYKIQTNQSGTRSIDISDEHLQTIRRHQLFRDLIDSNGYVDETVLDKLKLNVRAILESETDDNKALLDLCLDVIYHSNMKAFGLQKLVRLYIEWNERNAETAEPETRPRLNDRQSRLYEFIWNTDFQTSCPQPRKNLRCADGTRSM